MSFSILDIRYYLLNNVKLILLLFLFEMLSLCVICVGVVVNYDSLYSLLGALYSLSGLCIVCRGFV